MRAAINQTTLFSISFEKHKPTNVGRTALERQAGKKIDPPELEPLTSLSLTRCTAHSAIRALLYICFKRFYISNKLYFGVRAIEITQK